MDTSGNTKMSIEQKARAYDEAVKIARCWLNDPQTIQDCNYTIEDAIQNIFPQLRESEDERIIEEIKFAIMQMPSEREDTKQRCLAYLEKQKEHKPAEKQDYSGLNDLERAIHRGFLCAGVENVPVTIIKDTAAECMGFLALIEPKPAEWSEEDEKRVKEAIKRIDELEFLGIHCNNVRKVLESLRPSWKPSEEQMEALMLAIEGKCPPTSYMSRRLEDLYDGLANTYRIDAKLD